MFCINRMNLKRTHLHLHLLKHNMQDKTHKQSHETNVSIGHKKLENT